MTKSNTAKVISFEEFRKHCSKKDYKHYGITGVLRCEINNLHCKKKNCPAFKDAN